MILAGWLSYRKGRVGGEKLAFRLSDLGMAKLESLDFYWIESYPGNGKDSFGIQDQNMEEPYAEEPKLMFPICHYYINDKRGDIKMKYPFKKL